MILAIKYGIKGVKKARKSYKQHQAEKEQKLLTERGQLPDLQDPSRELDVTCQAGLQHNKSSASLSSSASSTSTHSAEKALENDPQFREYMEHQKALYLRHHHRSDSNPPSYNTIMEESRNPRSSTHGPTSGSTLSPTSPGHCSCHECIRRDSRSTPHPTTSIPMVPELPSSGTSTLYPRVPSTPAVSELGNSQIPSTKSTSHNDTSDMVFELHGNLPAILPDTKHSAY